MQVHEPVTPSTSPSFPHEMVPASPLSLAKHFERVLQSLPSKPVSQEHVHVPVKPPTVPVVAHAMVPSMPLKPATHLEAVLQSGPSQPASHVHLQLPVTPERSPCAAEHYMVPSVMPLPRMHLDGTPQWVPS